MNNINKFHTNGYDILTNKVSRETIDYLKSYTLELKNRMISNPQFEKNTKPNGTGTYGRFHDMASSSPLADDSENKKLFNVYTSQLMYEICKFYLMREKFYLFNDQVVVKLPKEPFHFEPHKDNQFGPTGPFPNRWDLKTLNCMIVLDDINDKNGGFKVKNRNTLQWDDLKLLQGDVLVMDGDTFHQSGDNKSDSPRRVYICHYSTEPLGKNFKRGFYFKRFYGELSKI
jgi:hypothetical protein